VGATQDFPEKQVSREIGQALKNLCSQGVFHARPPLRYICTLLPSQDTSCSSRLMAEGL
jgi:hypothetical protein